MSKPDLVIAHGDQSPEAALIRAQSDAVHCLMGSLQLSAPDTLSIFANESAGNIMRICIDRLWHQYTCAKATPAVIKVLGGVFHEYDRSYIPEDRGQVACIMTFGTPQPPEGATEEMLDNSSLLSIAASAHPAVATILSNILHGYVAAVCGSVLGMMHTPTAEQVINGAPLLDAQINEFMKEYLAPACTYTDVTVRGADERVTKTVDPVVPDDAKSDDGDTKPEAVESGTGEETTDTESEGGNPAGESQGACQPDDEAK